VLHSKWEVEGKILPIPTLKSQPTHYRHQREAMKPIPSRTLASRCVSTMAPVGGLASWRICPPSMRRECVDGGVFSLVRWPFR